MVDLSPLCLFSECEFKLMEVLQASADTSCPFMTHGSLSMKLCCNVNMYISSVSILLHRLYVDQKKCLCGFMNNVSVVVCMVYLCD